MAASACLTPASTLLSLMYAHKPGMASVGMPRDAQRGYARHVRFPSSEHPAVWRDEEKLLARRSVRVLHINGFGIDRACMSAVVCEVST